MTLQTNAKTTAQNYDSRPDIATLLQAISDHIFDAVIESHIRRYTGTNGDVENFNILKKDAQKDFYNWMEMNLGTSWFDLGVYENPKITELAKKLNIQSEFLAAFIYFFGDNPRSVRAKIKQIGVVFELNKSFDRSNDPKSASTPLFTRKVIDIKGINKTILSDICKAIQSTTIEIPLRLYGSSETVSKEIEALLIKILKDVENLRILYSLEFDISSFNSSSSLLYQSIAEADSYAWLPLKMLVTAALSKENLKLYARDSKDVERFTNQVIKGDGVFLVTGYRGVGKTSFINSALEKQQAQFRQHAAQFHTHIIPIKVNVAKVSNIQQVLRLCIRALYRDIQEYEQRTHLCLLTEQERYHLYWANYRIANRVNVSETETHSQLKQLAIELGLKPGEIFGLVKTASALGGFPQIGWKSAKELGLKYEQTVSMLDYDEDRAEEDILKLIEMLSHYRSIKPLDKDIFKRSEAYNATVKLVFIFDEMDKMDVKKGQEPIIRQLKNLFLAGNALFILVTSKEFYYMLLEDRKLEDSVLSSYFSAVVNVPLFTVSDTERLIQNLIDTKLTEIGKGFVQQLAGYLTYHSRGLPREIIREIGTMQQWLPETLQAYLCNLDHNVKGIQVYNEIERKLEELGSENLAVIEIARAEDVVSTERLWLDKGRQEQLRRAFYIFVEELLNSGILSANRDELLLVGKLAVVKNPGYSISNIYLNHFSYIPPNDFIYTLKQLGAGLKEIRIGTSGTAEGKQIFDFLVNDDVLTFRVLDDFYNITKRQIQQTDAQIDPSLPVGEALIQTTIELLGETSQISRSLAFNYLSNITDNLPETLQISLFHILTGSGNRVHRIAAAKRISPSIFYSLGKTSYMSDFVAQERDEQILQEFIKLCSRTENLDHERCALQIYTNLLLRHKTQPLSQSNLLLILASLHNLSEESLSESKDLFDIVFGILVSQTLAEPFSDSTFPLLSRLAVISKKNLVEILISTKQITFSANATEKIIYSAVSNPEVNNQSLWEKALAQKQNNFSQRVLEAIIGQINSQLGLPHFIFDWLQSEFWDLVDQKILINLSQNNPRVLYELEKQVKRVMETNESVALDRIRKVINVESNVKRPLPRKSEEEKPLDTSNPAEKNSSSSLWSFVPTSLFTMLLVIAAMLVAPTDINATMPIWGKLFVLFVNIIGLGGVSLIVIGSAIFVLYAFLLKKTDTSNIMKIAGGALAGFGVIVTLGGYGSLIFVLKQPISFIGQITLVIILGVGLVFLFVLQLIVQLLVIPAFSALRRLGNPSQDNNQETPENDIKQIEK